MAFDVYLQLTGANNVQGESTDKAHPNWIKISSFSFGANNPCTVSSGTTGLSAGQPSLSSFSVTKDTDTASVLLFQACCEGLHFTNMTVQVCTQSGSSATAQNVLCLYEFTNVLVEAVQWSATSGTSDRPIESVSFGFGSVQVTYTPITAQGAAGTKVGPAAWSVTQNTAANQG